MVSSLETNLLIVGGGPGGYVAAIRAGQLGVETVLVEADALGGTCLLRGCIPSKALIHAASQFAGMVRMAQGGAMGIALGAAPSLDLAKTVAWKNGIVHKLNRGVAELLKQAKVRVVRGWASFTDAKTCRVETAEGPLVISARAVILATGAEPGPLPALPFGGAVMSSTETLDLERLPRRLLVVGGGYIGLELGIALRKLGAAVTLVEACDRILPQYDRALTDPVKRWLDANGIACHLSTKVVGRTEENGATAVVVEQAGPGETRRIETDAVLVAVGRRPNTRGWGLENTAVDLDGPFVKIDDQCRTSVTGVWAIGDLAGEPMLAHKAMAQGEMVAEIVAGRRRRFDPAAIPAICFTEPEIVAVGLSPAQAEARQIDAIVGEFPFAANGRALSMEAGDERGFVRTVAGRADGRILGVQAVGANVSELSATFVQAIEGGAVIDDIAGAIYAHPTLSEAFRESALRTVGQAVHI